MTLLVLFFSCNQGAKTTKPSTDSLGFLVAKFQKDTLGCFGLRSKEVIEKIYDYDSLRGKSKEYLIAFLGNPNESTVSDQILVLKYFFNSTCVNHILIDSADICSANFYIEQGSNTVYDLDFTCE